MNNNLEQIKNNFEGNNPNNNNQFEIYQSYFPELEHEMFIKLKRNGMLGRLFRGQRIDLEKENIYIPFCLWRHAMFKDSHQYVPCVIKSENYYWIQK